MPAVRADPFQELADLVLAMNPDELGTFCRGLDAEDLAIIEQVMAGRRHSRWVPLPHQIPPPAEDPWELWLMLGGRGTGKTDGAAHAMDEHAKGPPCLPGLPGGHRMAIIAPTRGDASEACVNGPSGLRAHNPMVREVTRKGGTFVEWPSGAEAKLFGAYTKEDVERLRAGGNRCFVWAEELAAWRYLRACWNHMVLGLRLGERPRVVASTTPKNRPHLKKLIADPATVISTGTTFDNPHLAETTRAKYVRIYGGTRLGRQELNAEILEDIEGALWTGDQIERDRVGTDGAPTEVPSLRRVVVAVDPSWGTTNDECGIVVAGVDWQTVPHAYVLDDKSQRGGPAAWANAAAEAYWAYGADVVIAEGNFQGEQVKLAMAQVEHPKGRPPTRLVHASRGKALRAEPVVMLYEQHRVHHAGVLPGLEFQMCNWVPGEPPDADAEEGDDAAQPEHEGAQDDPETSVSEYSPDRVDALVFGLSDLMLGPGGAALVHRPTSRPAKPSASRSVQGRRFGRPR